ncbi:MAG: methylenetetrahydrofolate reductase [Clostridiales bacterium]|jgi:methylenetetrahydrofolate reductase (NADPH)|nr:methylenetetrahydrofolate reductase [Clostridiales bacterium]
MRIIDIIRQKKTTLSFEIFPPKENLTIDYEAVVAELAKLRPDFISVTNSAGGGGAATFTLDVARGIKQNHGIESIMHLVCAGASKPDIQKKLLQASDCGIDNILALRGDKINEEGGACDFYHASDLIAAVDKKRFCVGAAAYPEGHVDAESLDADIGYLKLKVELGADFLTTQLFYDNAAFFRFRELLAKKAINAPILCGIMPVMSSSQVGRMIFMCGASIPGELVKILCKYENDSDGLIKAGIDYAARQINGLIREGVDGIHLYTMNKPQIAKSITAVIDRGGFSEGRPPQ